MARKNEGIQELRQPDQFVSFWTRLGGKVEKHRRALLAVGIATLVVVAGVQASRAFFGHRAGSRSRDFARIDAIAAAPLIGQGDQVDSADGFPPRFKTDKERKEAAIKEADAFVAKHGGKLEDPALVLKAGYLLDTGRAAEALTLYQALASRVAPPYRFLVQEGLGYAYEATGNVDKALEAYTTLAQQAEQDGGFYRDRALFNRARLLEKKGSTKEAEAVYKEVVQKHPTSALRDEVNDRLAVLEGK